MKILDKVKIVKSVDYLPEIDIGHIGIITDMCERYLDYKLETCYGVSFLNGFEFYFKESELEVVKSELWNYILC